MKGYRSGSLTHHQAAQLLGFSRFELEDFLNKRKLYDHAYSSDNLQRDLADLDKLRHQGRLGG